MGTHVANSLSVTVEDSQVLSVILQVGDSLELYIKYKYLNGATTVSTFVGVSGAMAGGTSLRSGFQVQWGPPLSNLN